MTLSLTTKLISKFSKNNNKMYYINIFNVKLFNLIVISFYF